MVLKKCKKFDDILFINASEHYKPGKRQNHLREEDISKIVDAYKNRTEEDRYSRKVSMKEIEKNDFNLNISRYVSTAIDDVVIDLKEVHNKLVDIEKKAKKAAEKHNGFLKELGLPPV